MCKILDDNCYSEKYLIQTRPQAKSSGIKLSEVNGMGKNLEPNLKLEKTCHTQTRKYEKVMYRSGKSWIKKKKT